MKIYMLIEGTTFNAPVASVDNKNVCTQETQDRNVKPVPTLDEALTWCEVEARRKQSTINGSALNQIRKGKTLLGYKVTKLYDVHTYTFEEHELDLRTTCDKTRATLLNPVPATELELACAFDHVNSCTHCQQWAMETLHVGGNFDLQETIKRIREVKKP